MTHYEYDLAFRAVIGLAGCAMALVALFGTQWAAKDGPLLGDLEKRLQ